jgi:hypothetical protein
MQNLRDRFGPAEAQKLLESAVRMFGDNAEQKLQEALTLQDASPSNVFLLVDTNPNSVPSSSRYPKCHDTRRDDNDDDCYADDDDDDRYADNDDSDRDEHCCDCSVCGTPGCTLGIHKYGS